MYNLLLVESVTLRQAAQGVPVAVIIADQASGDYQEIESPHEAQSLQVRALPIQYFIRYWYEAFVFNDKH